MKKIVDKSKYLPRIIDKTVLEYLSDFGAVVVEGQSGVVKHGPHLITVRVNI